MPKIEAPTVAEHRAQVQLRLVDATEQLMRSGEPLTAASVAAGAGIARNSIYRYVASVDELRDMVVARYLPHWLDAVNAKLAAASCAEERISVWVHANLRQAADSGHGWLMAATRPAVTQVSGGAVDRAHLDMRATVAEDWLEVTNGDAQRAAVATALTVAVLEAGFRQLGRLDPELVIDQATRAAAGLITSLQTADR
ncbi:MAG: TetR family transcriptional regulator [Actinobacteria bacterium HGW-Actinobacteria-2]|nr:MAG: TetR family transcriptional regulator [Actinobacteria bacterium HGW-Actinobacteria-2]